MPKDKRYKTVKILIEGGHVSQFKEIFEHIPKTIVGKDMGIHFRRFNRMVVKADHFKIKDLYILASLIQVDEKLLFDLIYSQKKQARYCFSLKEISFNSVA